MWMAYRPLWLCCNKPPWSPLGPRLRKARTSLSGFVDLASLILRPVEVAGQGGLQAQGQYLKRGSAHQVSPVKLRMASLIPFSYAESSLHIEALTWWSICFREGSALHHARARRMPPANVVVAQ